MKWGLILPLLFAIIVVLVGIHTIYTREKTLRLDIWNTSRHSDDLYIELSGAPAVLVGLLEMGVGLGFLIRFGPDMLAQL